MLQCSKCEEYLQGEWFITVHYAFSDTWDEEEMKVNSGLTCIPCIRKLILDED